jgi:tripartite-type tricarboxylate transporter receptor subunit TctC
VMGVTGAPLGFRRIVWTAKWLLALSVKLSTAGWAQDYPAKPIRFVTPSTGGAGDFVTRVIAFSAGAMILGADVVSGQDYPNKPIRIITADPGGSNDFLSRVIAQGISEPMGQQVIVDNRASAVVAGMVAKSMPDGYTLLVTTGIVWILPFLQATSYDPVKDLAPITLAVSSPNILVVHPGVAVNSVKELIALAKAKPGELNYGSGATGSTSHLAAELFKAMAGVNIVRIPYKGAGPAVNGLIGGQVQLMIATSGSVAPHIKSGRLKALAVTSVQPSEIFPGLPTVGASGLPGYDAASMIGVFAPAKTPMAIVNRLNLEIVKTVNRPDAKAKLFNAGMEIVGSSPAQSAAAIKADMARMGKVIKDAGIHAE